MRQQLKGKLMDSLARWGGLDHFHSAFVLCLLILGWIVEPSQADPVTDSDLSQLEIRPLRLGQERVQEKLPFRGGGECVYELMDLKEAHWYEVKISYPASTPASFSIDLLPQLSEGSISSGRKLLNTEKIIFHIDKGTALQDTPAGTTWRVLVSVKPAGFIAIPYVQEQAFIIYNIVFEEVVFGIPLQAFWVGFLALMAIFTSVLASKQLVPRLQQLTFKSTKQAL